MMCWIDKDSGTYGVGEDNIVFVDMNDEQEAVFSELSDNDRIAIARDVQGGQEFGIALCNTQGFHDSGDNPVDDEGQAECELCGENVNALPDLG
jgi:hypothetical protein